MKKRYYIILMLAGVFIFSGTITWGGLAGTGGVTEANKWGLNSTTTFPKLTTWDVAIGTTTAAADLHIYDANATSTLFLDASGANGGSIILKIGVGGACVVWKPDVNGSIATSSIACPQ